ncbi:hypothetical protein COU91_00420 [Candidatus Saccharibacteria bacterium CG10_big_fil_rev_8_21_14_0_10_47_8]|nr:MAG: hypothetical protein COU91_00420 [Candidatus Saccharibacteria bacterium CG10_big_fil_rev_8_21_14_0_10_47_8]
MSHENDNIGSVAVMDLPGVFPVGIVDRAVAASAIDNPGVMISPDTTVWYRREATDQLTRLAAAGYAEPVVNVMNSLESDDPQVAYALGVNILRTLKNYPDSLSETDSKARRDVLGHIALILDNDSRLPQQDQTFTASDREFLAADFAESAVFDTWTWRQCTSCQGSRRILEKRSDGGLEPVSCPGCLGVGEQFKP